MKYLIMVLSNPESAAALRRLSEEQGREFGRRHRALSEALADSGELVVSEGLDDQSNAVRVRVREGETMTTDGPFAEVKEQLAGFYLVEGGKSVHAVELERKHAGSFSGEARADLRELRQETASLKPTDATADELSVYDICCQEPTGHEDEEDGPIVHSTPKPGRNDLCWCGSGKKYKKCHGA